jgi:hypothetical protein
MSALQSKYQTTPSGCQFSGIFVVANHPWILPPLTIRSASHSVRGPVFGRQCGRTGSCTIPISIVKGKKSKNAIKQLQVTDRQLLQRGRDHLSLLYIIGAIEAVTLMSVRVQFVTICNFIFRLCSTRSVACRQILTERSYTVEKLVFPSSMYRGLSTHIEPWSMTGTKLTQKADEEIPPSWTKKLKEKEKKIRSRKRVLVRNRSFH